MQTIVYVRCMPNSAHTSNAIYPLLACEAWEIEYSGVNGLTPKAHSPFANALGIEARYSSISYWTGVDNMQFKINHYCNNNNIIIFRTIPQNLGQLTTMHSTYTSPKIVKSTFSMQR